MLWCLSSLSLIARFLIVCQGRQCCQFGREAQPPFFHGGVVCLKTVGELPLWRCK
jgi:hypothetical protein